LTQPDPVGNGFCNVPSTSVLCKLVLVNQQLQEETTMNKFSMRTLPAALAVTAALAFAAHAQVRTGVNSNISADVRANAGSGASVNSNTSTNASVNSDGTVKRAVKRTGNAVQRTGDKVEGAVGNAADATRDGAYRAKNAVGGVASKADNAIQRNLPGSNNGPTSQVNVQGSGNVSAGGGVQRPPQ
jgi:hypothetical protein